MSTPNTKEKKNKKLSQMAKSQRKAKIGSFKVSKAWSLKTWAMARRNQAKIASPKEEAERAQHH